MDQFIDELEVEEEYKFDYHLEVARAMITKQELDDSVITQKTSDSVMGWTIFVLIFDDIR